jgi:uncharacterized protein (DUF885 family)
MSIPSFRYLLSLALALIFCLPAMSDAFDGGKAGLQTHSSGLQDTDESQNPQARQLHALFEAWDDWNVRRNPFTAAGRGDRSANALLPDASAEALADDTDTTADFLRFLGQIPLDSLEGQDRISYRLFQRMLVESVEAHELGHHRLPLNGWWDYHATFAEQPGRMPFETIEDYQNYIARLRAFETWNNQYIARLREAVAMGWVRPQVVLENYIPTVEALVTPAGEARFMEPFMRLNEASTIGTEDQRDRVIQQGMRVVAEVVMPAYRELARFLREEYYNAATQTIGVSALPGGAAYYRHLVRHYTTMDITPEEVHQTGLAEVARIRAEMHQVIESTGFEGTFAEFVHFLRTDSRFYAENPEELLRYTALVLKRMDGELPRYFGRLPRMPYGLREVPDYLAPRMTTAYYSRAPEDGSRAGYYYVNTYDLPSRPLYEVEALSFHEAVPGHHLQIALQQELEGLPRFRQTGGFTVFVEGWALYSEWLALEMGFYQDPYSNFGRLTYEMWRALRLVVDTGIHYMDWERQQAIDYMAENSALTLLNIRNEVDRYIFWPGQALAYKTGEIRIRQLRAQAEQALGDRFDIRAFHDVVLGNGAVTLEVLGEVVEQWIDSQL